MQELQQQPGTFHIFSFRSLLGKKQEIFLLVPVAAPVNQHKVAMPWRTA